MTKIHEKLRGFPGNQLAIDGSTDTEALEYYVGIRRPVKAIASTGYLVTPEESGTQFTYGGVGSAVTITLCPPQPGLWYEFAATGAIVSSGTTFNCASTDAFVQAGSSNGVGSVKVSATTVEFTKGGLYVEFVGLSTSRYLLRTQKGPSSVASTGVLTPAS